MSRPKVPLVRFADMHDEDVETREWIRRGSTIEFGHSTVSIECPFCQRVTTAFIWSLAGTGKRCRCGALFGSLGSAYKRKEPEPKEAG